MKLLTLKINNFLSFKKAEINLESTGLVAVKGKNLDDTGSNSNGSGKSSLFIAIRWCLYGNMDKAATADEVVNSTAGKNCWVETVWLDELTGIHYRITRYRKDTKHKNKLRLEDKHPGLDWEDKTLGKNELTQTKVDEALGMDSAVFVAACFASQEDPIDIPAMKDSELKNLLENALPFAKLDPLYKKYKDILDKLTKEHAVLLRSETDISHTIAVNENLWTDTKAQEGKHLSTQATKQREILSFLSGKKAELNKLLENLPDITAVRASKSAVEAQSRSLGVSGGSTVALRLEAAKRRLNDLTGETGKCPTCGNDWHDSAFMSKTEQKKADLQREINEYELQLDQIRKNVPLYNKLQDEEVRLIGIIDQYGIDNREITTLKQTMQHHASTYKNLEGNPFAEIIKNLEETIKANKIKHSDVLTKMEALNKKIIIYTNLVDALSPKGFRYHMLESVTKELNTSTNYYLGMLTDGKIGAAWSTVKKLASGEYKEAFSIRVSMNGRTNFGLLSGGQKKKVRLACWFALQDLIAERAEKDVKLWVCDEVDGALDKSGIERLMSLLEEKARTKETVLVISHNPMSDWISNSVTVTMKDDVSEVSGFLNVI